MPELIQGENSIREIAAKVINAGYSSVFLIHGQHFKEQNDYNFLQGLTVNHFIKSGVNADEPEAKMAFHQFLQHKEQAIVAVGGGSVIDIAKYIIYRLAETSSPIPFFAAVPTTAGSGSEATHFAVIYQDKQKISFVHPSLLPELVILDPNLTCSLSSYQTAVSGIDVLAQAVESYWNINATGESKQFAVESIFLWKDFFSKAVDSPDEITRERMLLAAHLAGKAINITRTTGPHALSYYLTANHNIAHGQAVSIFLPVFFLYNKPLTDLCRLLQIKNEEDAGDMIREKMKRAGLAVNFSELGIDKESIIEPLLNGVNEERFNNNPQKFDPEKLRQLILKYL